MAYSEKLMDHFNNPRNVGTLDENSPRVGTGVIGAPACGDVMKIYIAVDGRGVITDAKFKTFGCVSAIASTDVACDMIKGKTIDEALGVTNKDVLNFLGGLPAQKIHCSVLAQEAIIAAVEDYHKQLTKKKNKK